MYLHRVCQSVLDHIMAACLQLVQENWTLGSVLRGVCTGDGPYGKVLSRLLVDTRAGILEYSKHPHAMQVFLISTCH